jgi:type I restriction enzyme specificity protein hsdS
MKNNRTFLEKLLDGAEVEWRTLGEVSELRNTGVDKKINESEKSVRLLNFTDVFNNQYLSNSTPTMIVTASDKKIIDCNILKGDLFITPTSEILDEIGQSAVALENIDNAVYSYHIMRIRIHDTNFLLPEFLNYLFRTSQIKQQIRKNAQGITRFGLTLPRWKSLVIPIPPLSVQTEIVKILDALTALTSELTLRRKQYEYYRETLLSPDNLEQLNTGGAKKKLSDVVNIYLGLTYTPTYVENGVKFISAQNTSNDFLDLSNTKFISREEFEKSTSNAKPKRGDILFTRVGSNLGHPVIVDTDEDLCIFVSLGFLRVKDKNILNSYIKHWMNTDLFWKQVEKNVHGSAKVNLNTGWLKNFEIYIPPLEEQQRIVSILDKFETLTNSITEGLPLAIEQSQKRYEYNRELLLNFS